jgi:hypothetical protein
MCLPVKPYKIEREWKHAGLSCAVVQAREGAHRCGYVRVPPAHPMFGKSYNDVDVNVHGGLTFAAIEPCTEHEDGQGFWFGFDCAHSGDASYDPKNLPDHEVKFRAKYPELRTSYRLSEHYWTEAEVVSETEKLAEQLARL